MLDACVVTKNVVSCEQTVATARKMTLAMAQTRLDSLLERLFKQQSIGCTTLIETMVMTVTPQDSDWAMTASS